MINQQHPIIPPEDLLQQLRHSADTWLGQITIAYQAGANQELEACCEWLECNYNYPRAGHPLRLARRPKPPSLKEQALKALTAIEGDFNTVGDRADTIRRALEALPND
jgi:hypothetical protein